MLISRGTVDLRGHSSRFQKGAVQTLQLQAAAPALSSPCLPIPIVCSKPGHEAVPAPFSMPVSPPCGELLQGGHVWLFSAPECPARRSAGSAGSTTDRGLSASCSPLCQTWCLASSVPPPSGKWAHRGSSELGTWLSTCLLLHSYSKQTASQRFQSRYLSTWVCG